VRATFARVESRTHRSRSARRNTWACVSALALVPHLSSCSDDGPARTSGGSTSTTPSVTATVPDPFAAEERAHPGAARLDPTHVDPATQKLDSGLSAAWRALKGSQWKEARDLAGAYTGAHRGQAEFVIGLTYHRQMLYAPAVEHFLRALQLEPSFLETYFYAGHALLNVGRLDEARAAFAVYARYEPDEPSVPFGQGLVEIEADHPDPAEHFLQRAIDLATKKRATAQDPRPIDADLGRYYARLGDVYVRRDDNARAREAFERAAKLRDDMSEIWSKLALARERAGDTAGAAAARAKYEEIVSKGAGSVPPR
jgi:tetratricopeptide (TPR) repeat protein